MARSHFVTRHDHVADFVCRLTASPAEAARVRAGSTNKAHAETAPMALRFNELRHANVSTPMSRRGAVQRDVAAGDGASQAPHR